MIIIIIIIIIFFIKLILSQSAGVALDQPDHRGDVEAAAVRYRALREELVVKLVSSGERPSQNALGAKARRVWHDREPQPERGTEG